ncbi:MAG: hypothetical protein WC310_05865 [Patescibacteria group bacterium]|jgi:predicted membrane protein
MAIIEKTLTAFWAIFTGQDFNIIATLFAVCFVFAIIYLILYLMR